MSSSEEEKEKKLTLHFYLSGSIILLWDELADLPQYQNRQDLFRDMLRTFHESKRDKIEEWEQRKKEIRDEGI